MQTLVTFLTKKKKKVKIKQLHISVLVFLLNILLENMFIKMKRVRQDRTDRVPVQRELWIK